MISDVEKANAAPLPLPPSAWRINHDLITAIERSLTDAGHQLLRRGFTDTDCPHWQVELMFGNTVDVAVDRHIRPGTVTIVVSGEDSASIQTLLHRYKQIPILKICTTVAASELLCQLRENPYRRIPWLLTDRLQFVIRRRLFTARYRIVREEYLLDEAAWVICLHTTEQLKIEGLDQHSKHELTITGFGTELRPLERLIAVFDDGS
jgi:hypothetical protein